jgi:hypothetical protein
MISEEIIHRGGSKLEITRALLEHKVNIPIPRSAWKYYGESLDTILPDFHAMYKPVIVRGSHPNDYHGFIDVIPTYRNIVTQEQLESAIRDIENEAVSNAVMLHSQDWGQPFNPAVHILIQEQSWSELFGTMMRHPHTKDLLIQYTLRNWERYSLIRPAVSYAQKKGDELYHKSSVNITDESINQLIEMFENLENSGILDPAWAYQMEFGLRPLLFFQARPFKRFQTAASFEIPNYFGSKVPHITAHQFFGITPPEGIELQFDIVDRWEMYSRVNNFDTSSDYGLLSVNKLYSSSPAERRFGRVKVLCSACDYFNFLFHHNYRLMKKSEISLIAMKARNIEKTGNFEYKPEDFSDFRESRVYCNGDTGIIIPTKYLS